jgi:hypothetical protein
VANGTIAIDEPSTIDKLLDTESLTVGANTVQRERVQVTGASALEVAVVKNADPASNDYALAVRAIPSATATPVSDGGGSITVDGTVSISGALDTELPAAAALADGAGNPTTPTVGSANLVYNGTTWDRARGDIANGLDVDVTRSALPTGAATESTLGTRLSESDFDAKTGSLTEAAPASDTASSGLNGRLQRIAQRLSSLIALLPAALVGGRLDVNLGAAPATVTVANAGTFAVQDTEKVADNAGFTDGTTKVQPAGYVFDEVAGTALTENDAAAARIDSKRAQVLVIEDETTRGRRVTVTAANALKVDGSAVTQPISGNLGLVPVTSGGCAGYHTVATGSNNAASIKGTAGQLYGVHVFNNAAYPVYVKIYNKATAPAPATDNALLIDVIGVQAGTQRDWVQPDGKAYGTGIGIAIVKNIGDTDNTSVVANDAVVDVDYK